MSAFHPKLPRPGSTIADITTLLLRDWPFGTNIGFCRWRAFE